MREITVSGMDAGQRLNKYLMKYLQQAPSSFLYKMMRKKNITCNGKKASGNEILQEGDKIRLFLSEETIEKFRAAASEPKAHGSDKTRELPLRILYQDADILAVDKPRGVLSQKARNTDYTINEAVVDYCRQMHIVTDAQYETFHPSVANRLDRNTSGIILAGISPRGSRYLAEVLKLHTCEKYYQTIVVGEMPHVIHDTAWLIKDHQKNRSIVSHTRSAQADRIETIFTPLAAHAGYTLLSVQLLTGKSHQIRAHLQALGYPMAGDPKYGDPKTNAKLKHICGVTSQLLHAAQIRLPDKPVIQDPLPEEFLRAAKKLGLTEYSQQTWYMNRT